MEWSDMPVIRGIVRSAATDDYRFATLLTAIVKSPPFRMQQVAETSPTPVIRQAAVTH
jgi:hypothetical protein